MKTKLIVLSIAALLCTGITGCGAKNEPVAVMPAETTSAETTEAATESTTETTAAAFSGEREPLKTMFLEAGVWGEAPHPALLLFAEKQKGRFLESHKENRRYAIHVSAAFLLPGQLFL